MSRIVWRVVQRLLVCAAEKSLTVQRIVRGLLASLSTLGRTVRLHNSSSSLTLVLCFFCCRFHAFSRGWCRRFLLLELLLGMTLSLNLNAHKVGWSSSVPSSKVASRGFTFVCMMHVPLYDGALAMVMSEDSTCSSPSHSCSSLKIILCHVKDALLAPI